MDGCQWSSIELEWERAQQLHITMGAIKSGFRISIYKDRTNGDKNVRKMKKKLLFFLFLLIQGIDEFMVYWCYMVWSATRFGPLPPCSSLMIAAIYYDIYIRGGDGVLLNGAHRKGESPGNILSKTTSSGMTNDEYTGLPILICMKGG